MWLSERAGGGAPARLRAGVGTVTVGGENAAVLLSGEARGLGVAAPTGVHWVPGQAQQALVIETDDGERYILGVVGAEGAAPGDGELRLSIGETAITVGAAGINVTGRLFVNGTELCPPVEQEEA